MLLLQFVAWGLKAIDCFLLRFQANIFSFFMSAGWLGWLAFRLLRGRLDKKGGLQIFLGLAVVILFKIF